MTQQLASVFFTGCLVLISGCSGTREMVDQPSSSNEITPPPIVYHPPQRDAPMSRIARIPRGASMQLPRIAVLMPEQVAYTAQEQPLLFWFISKPTDVKCRISLHDVGKTPHQVIFETSMDGISARGIQKLDLLHENVRLRPGATYQWLIALVPNPSAPSNNIAAGGLLQRMTPTGELSAKLAGKSAAEQAKEYAAAGFWFDALSILAGAIDANPEDESLQRMRTSLLLQANLKEPAEADVGG
jgi:hypothetical protein